MHLRSLSSRRLTQGVVRSGAHTQPDIAETRKGKSEKDRTIRKDLPRAASQKILWIGTFCDKAVWQRIYSAQVCSYQTTSVSILQEDGLRVAHRVKACSVRCTARVALDFVTETQASPHFESASSPCAPEVPKHTAQPHSVQMRSNLLIASCGGSCCESHRPDVDAGCEMLC